MLMLVACSTTSDTRVHLAVTAVDASLTFDRYQILVGDLAALAQPLAAIDVELPGAMAGSARAVDVWGLDAGQQIAFGSTTVTPVEHQTVTAEVTLAAATCGASCTLGESECTGSGTSTCQLVGSCLAFGPPTACGSGEVCSAGTCSAPPACAGSACDDGNPCTIDDACSAGACTGTPKCTTAPANAAPTCGADGTCDFACTSGYARSGSACVAEAKQIFITEAMWNGDFGGLSGADHRCQAAATAAGLTGTFMAWMSDRNTAAADRLTHAAGPYRGIDGSVVAASWTALTSGHLQNAIGITEVGDIAVGIPVWTDTLADGTPHDADCLQWTDPGGGSSTGDQGDSDDTTASWTENSQAACSSLASLFCLEQ